ncbi:hypothetical protein RHSIM_Rhsim09G0062900 [Rhododendron simsii]|uniref:Uncharacterized protein n=1 Tax=Rhododendron simsii TaxID=118357 RepID=A0A834GHD0_RHOSS|nr:hypothetical protein RHSIM_Rhsim09G0062900 [Rhododendron simsii]
MIVLNALGRKLVFHTLKSTYDDVEAHGQATGFKHNFFKGYETEAEARKAYSTYLSKHDGSSSEKFDGSHDQQALAHQLKITLKHRDKLQEELNDLRAKLGFFNFRMMDLVTL